MEMQVANRLLGSVTGRSDEVHSGRFQGSLNCLSDHEARGGQVPRGALVGVPEICNVNPGNDQRVAWSCRVEREEGNPRSALHRQPQLLRRHHCQ